MNLIERYLYQVEKYLPKNSKEEISNELRSHILEQLADQEIPLDDDDQVASILKELGRPRTVAVAYTNQEGIIAKELIPTFYLIIKIFLYVIPIAFLIIGIITYLSTNQTYDVLDLLLSIIYRIPDMILSFFTSLGILFTIFAFISKTVDKSELVKYPTPEFDPRRLPNIPTSIYKISVVEQIFGLLFSAIFIYVINYQQGIISIYYNDIKYPLLNQSFDQLLTFINIGIVVAILLSVVHLYLGRKTIMTKSIEFIHKIYTAVILFILASTDIFNQTVINGYDLSIVPTILTIILIIVGLITMIEGLVSFIKIFTYKERKQ